MHFTTVRRMAAVAAIALAAGSALRAQEQRPTEFDNWAIPGWTFTPSFSVSGLWDSNVSLAANQAEGRRTASDRMFMLEPHGQLDYRSPRTDFTGGYKGYARRYLDVSALNSFDHRAFASLRRHVSRRVTFFVQDDFSDAPTTDEIALHGIPYTRTGSRSNRLGAGIDVRMTKYDDLSVRYDNTWVEFDNPSAFLRGGVMNGIRTDYMRRLGERTKVGAQYRFRHSSLNSGTRAMQFHDIGSVFEQMLSRAVTLRLAGGYSIARDPGDTGNHAGAYLEAELAHETPRASTGLRYERSLAPAFGFGGASENQELRGYVRMPFSRNRIYLLSSAGWRSTDRLSADDLSFDSFDVDNTVGYSLARWLRLEAFHRYSRQDSRITGGEINRHRAGGQIVVSQPMRIR